MQSFAGTSVTQRPPIVRFGEYQLDRPSRELSSPGVRVRLQEQPFQVLSLLLEHSGDVVTREELHRRIWPASVYVDFDHGLNNAITRLRKALGEHAAAPQFIETLPRLGYRFMRAVADEPRPDARSTLQTSDGGDIRAGGERTAPVHVTPRSSVPNLVAGLAIVVAAGLLAVMVRRLVTPDRSFRARGRQQPANRR